MTTNSKKWGGRRTGSARKKIPKGAVNHMRRARVSAKYPMHMTLRLQKSIQDIRRQRLLRAFREGIQMAAKYGLRVIQYSIQTNHLHLIVEAEDNRALSRGMQSLVGRFAKIIRAHIGGKGSVFAGRYHLSIIRTSAYMKKALEYVLLNTAKHLKYIEHIDDYSSGDTFTKWRELLGSRFRDMIELQVTRLEYFGRPTPHTFAPKTWLASRGWLTV